MCGIRRIFVFKALSVEGLIVHLSKSYIYENIEIYIGLYTLHWTCNWISTSFPVIWNVTGTQTYRINPKANSTIIHDTKLENIRSKNRV